MTNSNPIADTKLKEIQQQVVGMYSEHPWPGYRNADEEMGWRLRLLGIQPEDYKGKLVIDIGCGTGEYAQWYASHGAHSVVGVDLSEPSLEIAQNGAEQLGIENVRFETQDVLRLSFPAETFDYAYSVGVLHHTGSPLNGFAEMCRITKPGGVVIVSLYNRFTRGQIGVRQRILDLLAGEDIDRRARLGQRLFPFTMRALSKRYHNANQEELAYDTFGVPHESYHTANEVLSWFDANGIEYIGSFAPLRVSDYLYAFSLPEYHQFKATFDGFPAIKAVSALLNRFSGWLIDDSSNGRFRKRPSALSMWFCQLVWALFGIRLQMFTIAGRKLH